MLDLIEQPFDSSAMAEIAQGTFGARKEHMRQYELTYLISDNVPESDLNKVTGKVLGYIKDAGGELLKEEIWGRRKLAYPIQKLEFATYITVNFDLPSDKAKEFEHNIVMTRKIIRHLIIVKDFGTEELTLTAEDIAETKEIEKVVGGEKSFEAVLGETEESKDLMSVRGEIAPEMDTPDQERIADVTEKQTEEEQPETNHPEPEAIKEPVEEIKETEGKAPKKKAAPKKAKKAEDNEADRLSKLDKELDDILGEEL